VFTVQLPQVTFAAVHWWIRKIRPGFFASICALKLLIGWQEWYPSHQKSVSLIPTGFPLPTASPPAPFHFIPANFHICQVSYASTHKHYRVSTLQCREVITSSKKYRAQHQQPTDVICKHENQRKSADRLNIAWVKLWSILEKRQTGVGINDVLQSSHQSTYQSINH